MSLREWLQGNSVTVTIGAIVLMIIALGLIAMQFRVSSIPDIPGYWLDLETHEVFVAEIGQQSPIEAPSGGDGVRAHLFSCSACSSDAWFGYLEAMSDAYLQTENSSALNQMNPIERQQFMQSQSMVRLLDDESDNWISKNTQAGQRLIEDVRNHCASTDGKLIRCEP